MEEINMYWNDPEQRLDPPEMSFKQENYLEEVENLINKISKLHGKVEDHFEELTVAQIEDILSYAEEYLDDIEDLSDEAEEEEGVDFEDEHEEGSWMVEEIECWLEEKIDAIKTEGDN
jgi:hypothetical protein